MPRLDGVDVSVHQGTIDWARVPALDFVACKATQRSVDPTFRRNWDAMRLRAFPARGAYHFNDNPAVRTMGQQARLFRSTVGELTPGEFPIIDFEPWEGGGIPTYTEAQARDLRNAVEDEFQRQAMIYCGFSVPAVHVIEGRPWWLPSYGISEAGMLRQAARAGVPVSVWQWGGGDEGADVPGITPGARDDSNQVQDLPALLAWANAPMEDDGMAVFSEDDKKALMGAVADIQAVSHDTQSWVKGNIAQSLAVLVAREGDQISAEELQSAITGALADRFDVELKLTPKT